MKSNEFLRNTVIAHFTRHIRGDGGPGAGDIRGDGGPGAGYVVRLQSVDVALASLVQFGWPQHGRPEANASVASSAHGDQPPH